MFGMNGHLVISLSGIFFSLIGAAILLLLIDSVLRIPWLMKKKYCRKEGKIIHTELLPDQFNLIKGQVLEKTDGNYYPVTKSPNITREENRRMRYLFRQNQYFLQIDYKAEEREFRSLYPFSRKKMKWLSDPVLKIYYEEGHPEHYTPQDSHLSRDYFCHIIILVCVILLSAIIWWLIHGMGYEYITLL